MNRVIIPTIIVIVLLLTIFRLFNGQYATTVVSKVTDLQSQQLVSGSKNNMNTKIRYLVIIAGYY